MDNTFALFCSKNDFLYISILLLDPVSMFRLKVPIGGEFLLLYSEVLEPKVITMFRKHESQSVQYVHLQSVLLLSAQLNLKKLQFSLCQSLHEQDRTKVHVILV